jgi:hypothetical protein
LRLSPAVASQQLASAAGAIGVFTHGDRLHLDRFADLALVLAVFRAGFLRTVFRDAVRRVGVEVRFARIAFLFLTIFFLVAGLRLTAFLTFFATALTAPPTALPAVTAKPFAPSKPALAVSATAAPVPTTAAFAVPMMPPLALAICPPFSNSSLIFVAEANGSNGQKRVFP